MLFQRDLSSPTPYWYRRTVSSTTFITRAIAGLSAVGIQRLQKHAKNEVYSFVRSPCCCPVAFPFSAASSLSVVRNTLRVSSDKFHINTFGDISCASSFLLFYFCQWININAQDLDRAPSICD